MTQDIEQFRPGFEAWARKECRIPADVPLNWRAQWTNEAWSIWLAAKLEARTEPNPQYAAYVSKCQAGGILPCSLEAFESSTSQGAAPSELVTLANAITALPHLHGRGNFAKALDFGHYTEGHEEARNEAAKLVLEFAARCRAEGGNTNDSKSSSSCGNSGVAPGDALDAARWRYIEEHASTRGGGNGFTITCFVPIDAEDMGYGIDAAIATSTSKGEG